MIGVPAMNPLVQGRLYQIVNVIWKLEFRVGHLIDNAMNWNLRWGISGVLSRYL